MCIHRDTCTCVIHQKQPVCIKMEEKKKKRDWLTFTGGGIGEDEIEIPAYVEIFQSGDPDL